MFIYLFVFEGEKDRVWRGGAERQEDTESEPGSRLGAISTKPNVGLRATNHEIMTWSEVGCFTDWATQVPQKKGTQELRDWISINVDLQKTEAYPLSCELSSRISPHLSSILLQLTSWTSFLYVSPVAFYLSANGNSLEFLGQFLRSKSKRIIVDTFLYPTLNPIIQ